MGKEFLECNHIPDIVIVKGTSVSILELTHPFYLNIKNTQSRKCYKYAGLISDIESEGHECINDYNVHGPFNQNGHARNVIHHIAIVTVFI